MNEQASVTQMQFYEAMQKLEDKLQDYHRRQRDHIDSKAVSFEHIFRAHEEEDALIEKRVTRIEEERRAEGKALARLSAMTSAVTSAAVVAVAQFFKR